MTTYRRSLPILLAVLYGLSVTTSVLFHNHRLLCDRSEPLAEPGHATEHPCDDCATNPHDDPFSPPQPCPDDPDCCVCHFLAQKLIPADPITEVGAASLVQRSVRVEPIRLPYKHSPSIHSRAPPAAV